MADTRAAALKLLKRVTYEKAYSNLVLDKYLSSNSLTAQEKRFISAMFYGVIERMITLDAVIGKYSRLKLSKLDPELLNILRMGIYQLLYMDSVPDPAAVNESVRLAKRCKNPVFSGYVNGVLRSFVRDGKKIPVSGSRAEQLSVKYSCPVWLVEKWLTEYGGEFCIKTLEAAVSRPLTAIRVNPLKTTDDELAKHLEEQGFAVEKTDFEHCLKISGGAPELTNAFRQGMFHVQDMSCQLCCMALGPKKGETVLDMCSAPGGKAFTIAEMMGGSGRVMSYDIYESRTGLVRQGAARLGLENITADVNDASAFNEQLPKADRVLCDVPCSGLGVIGKKPEIKYKEPISFAELPQLQSKILKASAGYVKKGGTLVYSTCTLSKAENEMVVDKFLGENHDFAEVPVISGINELSTGKATIFPHYFNSDGFFIAKMKRIN